MKRKHIIVLALLGLLSIVVLAVPELGILPMLVIIGIPISIAYWSVPALFLIATISYVIYHAMGFSGRTGALLAVSLSGILLAIPAYMLNMQMEKQAFSHVSNDHNSLTLPLPFGKIAVVTKGSGKYAKDSSTRCDGFCLHALLSGSARSILMLESREPFTPLQPDAEAVEFTIERLPQCPETIFASGRHTLSLPNGKSRKKGTANAVELIKLKISEGECLVSKKAKLSDADIVITRGRAISGGSHASRPGFRLFTDTIIADRITVHQKMAMDGAFDEVYRWTGVTFKPFAWILVPAPQSGYGFDVNMGWWRSVQRINIAKRYDDKSDWPLFLTGTLGFDLQLDGTFAEKRIIENMEKVLAENRAPSPEEWSSFSDYLDRRGLIANADAARSDFEIAYQMLENGKFPTPPRLYQVVNHAVKNTTPQQVAHLTEMMISRMEDGTTWAENLKVSRKKELANLAAGLRRLPDEYLLPHFERHVKLASNQAVQTAAWRFISQLHIHGERAVPTLLEQIGAGLEGGDRFYRSNAYQHPYLAGMIGLCLAGPQAKSASPKLLRLMQEGQLPAHASYGDLMVNTLVRTAIDPELIWPVYSAANKNRTRENFDREVKRAKSDRPDCSY